MGDAAPLIKDSMAAQIHGVGVPPLKELAMSVRQLATLVRAGVVIHTALETVALQCENPSLKQSFEEVAREVTGGASLSKAMARHPRVFDDPFVNAVDAGQMSGKLDLILMRLATFMEIGLKRRASVKAALRHPVIVLCAFTAAFFFLVRFVVPQFTNIFSRLHTNGADIGE